MLYYRNLQSTSGRRPDNSRTKAGQQPDETNKENKVLIKDKKVNRFSNIKKYEKFVVPPNFRTRVLIFLLLDIKMIKDEMLRRLFWLVIIEKEGYGSSTHYAIAEARSNDIIARHKVR
jgi:hypothetical protein